MSGHTALHAVRETRTAAGLLQPADVYFRAKEPIDPLLISMHGCAAGNGYDVKFSPAVESRLTEHQLRRLAAKFATSKGVVSSASAEAPAARRGAAGAAPSVLSTAAATLHFAQERRVSRDECLLAGEWQLDISMVHTKRFAAPRRLALDRLVGAAVAGGGGGSAPAPGYMDDSTLTSANEQEIEFVGDGAQGIRLDRTTEQWQPIMERSLWIAAYLGEYSKQTGTCTCLAQREDGEPLFAAPLSASSSSSSSFALVTTPRN